MTSSPGSSRGVPTRKTRPRADPSKDTWRATRPPPMGRIPSSRRRITLFPRESSCPPSSRVSRSPTAPYPATPSMRIRASSATVPSPSGGNSPTAEGGRGPSTIRGRAVSPTWMVRTVPSPTVSPRVTPTGFTMSHTPSVSSCGSCSVSQTPCSLDRTSTPATSPSIRSPWAERRAPAARMTVPVTPIPRGVTSHWSRSWSDAGSIRSRRTLERRTHAESRARGERISSTARGRGSSSPVPQLTLTSGRSGGLYHARTWYSTMADMRASSPTMEVVNGPRRAW